MNKTRTLFKKELFNLRKKIDFIDGTILSLINFRIDLVKNIGHLKKREGLCCLVDNIREFQILSRLKTLNKGPLESHFLFKIFSNIIAASKSVQIKK